MHELCHFVCCKITNNAKMIYLHNCKFLQPDPKSIQKKLIKFVEFFRLYEPQHCDISRTFGIQHYAGRVVYDATDFLGKDMLLQKKPLLCHVIFCALPHPVHISSSIFTLFCFFVNKYPLPVQLQDSKLYGSIIRKPNLSKYSSVS